MTRRGRAFGATVAVVLVGVLSTGTARATSTLDQTSPIAGSMGGGAVWFAQSLTQTFTAGMTGRLTSVDVGLYGMNGPSGNLTVKIEATTNGLPNGSVLASRTLNAGELAGITGSTQWLTVTFASPADVTSGTLYALTAESTDNPYTLIWPSGGAYSGGTWLTSGGDLPFATYVAPVSVAASNDAAPAPVVQEFQRPVTGTCADAASATLNWAGVASGGWGESWAAWVNGGTGGAVCTRTLVYSASQGIWMVG